MAELKKKRQNSVNNYTALFHQRANHRCIAFSVSTAMDMKFLIILLVVEAVIVLGKPANQDEGKIKIIKDELVEKRGLKQGKGF